ncbi:hypothetical protein MPTK1_8g08010 [Marchantia polymorpha subsp. ruderalis]|nr:hypothetical protein MARPO_0155s0016 [Marchantia polymorpha]BBN19116.1 hypothetical protein Mp_8g08010 [Marchantia polymorpha subsp. ruderalis]|eukprot:PTQ28754.1 hypothetical protein MARPO_0155s0016 [Marchantia polymorpha]
MVAIWEYRIVLPFTVEEYKIAQLYMVAKYSASESSEDNGDGVEVLKNEPFEERDRRGQYTHKLYHLASKLPSWLVSLLPKKALMLEEEAWNAYPHCTTVLKCPFFNKFRLILETTHLPDRGTSDNALGLDPKTLKKRQVEYIDIATDQVENYVEDEDPTKFKSQRTGRGPLQEGWSEKCEPVMCAYKCVTVDVPYWGFGSRIEKFISKNAQRKILLEGHRKCFCWLDEWHGLTMDDVRRMEYETAEAMAKARAMALRRRIADDDAFDCAVDGLAVDEEKLGGQDSGIKSGLLEEQPITPRLGTIVAKVPGGSLSRSNTPRSGTPRSKDFSGSPSLMRRPSLVGPSFSVGITTLSASDVDDFNLGGSAPPMPLSQWSSALAAASELENGATNDLASSSGPLLRNGSCESFNSIHSGAADLAAAVEDSADVAQCVDVLDRAINWTKSRAKMSPGNKASGKVAPLQSNSGHNDEKTRKGTKEVEHYVGVLENALSAVKKRPSKSTQ